MPVNKKAEGKIIGKVVSVQGPVVDIAFDKSDDVPNISGVIKTYTVDNEEVVLEVAEHLPGNVARCIAINSTINLQRHAKAYVEGTSIEIQVGDELFGRIINVLGQPIDEMSALKCSDTLPIRGRGDASEHKVEIEKRGRQTFDIMESQIKIIDLLYPLVKGSKNGILGGAALGKSIPGKPL